MPHFEFVWFEEVVEHLAEHGIDCDDFEELVCWSKDRGFSRSSGLPAVWGWTRDGRHVMAVYEFIDAVTVKPVTAFEVAERRRRTR